ncbi:MAG: NAD(P)H-hydrate dehydratase [Oscillospiraceae bacterium]|nr:NAD(P)H-hydrate dehydratase [Oscillospiraceae bacterium]
MKKVLTVEAMRRADADTIAAGTPGRELMARAARGIYESWPWQGETAILCGSGNNAGDGYALALLLRSTGHPCRLLRLGDRLSEDGRYYYEQCLAQGIPEEACSESTGLEGYEQIVDCLFGTGFRGSVTGLAAELIEKANRSKAKVVAADIPSGLSGTSGLGEPCVRADMTVSIGYPQPGHYLGKAKDAVGILKNIDIGIPAPKRYLRLAEEADFRELLAPRKNFSNKGDYGYVALMGGCRQYSGAAKLASLSRAALRCGCGVGILAVPESIAEAVTPYLLESTLCPLPEKDGCMAFDPAALDGLMGRVKALALGMGWGQGADNAKILTYILRHFEGPLVLDADALNTLASLDRSIFWETKAKLLLTPHLREFTRLSGLTKEEVLADPAEAAERYAAETGAIVLLKGPATLVTDGEETWLTDAGCPGMATAGSGDVLTGVLAGLLGWAPFGPKTAVFGAYLAGKAGEAAQAEQGDIAMTAGDTIDKIPQVLRSLRKGEKTMVYYKRIPMETLVNTRDLGGYSAGPGKVTKYGVFIRTDCPIGISERDKKFLLDQGVTLSIDLRGVDEVESQPSGMKDVPGHTYIHCPISEEHRIIKSNDGEKEAPPPPPRELPKDFNFGDTYVEMLEMGKPWAKKVIELCAAWEGTVMFHCFIGKDRAGTIAALLLGAAGVCDTDIMMDYSAPMSCLRPKYLKMGADFLPKKGGRPDFSWGFFGSVPETMETALCHLNEKYGGVTGYLKDAGVSEETLQKLRDKFVEDAEY